MKLTDKQISEHYDITPLTVTNYRNGSAGKKRLYLAMKDFILKEKHSIIWEATLINGRKELVNDNEIGAYIISRKDIVKMEIVK